MEKTFGLSKFARAILLIEFLLVAYMLFVLTSSIYGSYQIDAHIKQFEQENQRLARENEQLSNDFLYFTSEAYQEKIAKQNFGLVNSGEEIIILPESETATFAEEEQEQVKHFRRWNAASTPRKWYWFFFEREKF